MKPSKEPNKNNSQLDSRRRIGAGFLGKMLKCIRFLLVLAGLIFLCKFFVSPSYIDVDVPVKGFHSNDFWWLVEKSTVKWDDSRLGAHFRVLRKYTTAYSEVTGWTTYEEVVKYFDQALAKQGWQRSHTTNEGDWAIPLSELLKREVIVYKRMNQDTRDTTRICLGVWEIELDTPSFEIVLATVNPSAIEKLLGEMDV